MNYKSIAKKIIELKNADLQLRKQLSENGSLSEGYNDKMEMLHNRNAELLDKIIETIGYPSIDKVGKKANEAAWLVIQHSIGNPAFMKKCADLMKRTADKNKLDPVQLAYLTDRIAVFEGKPQLYGTQFDCDENGELNPNLYDDLTKVDQRRKDIGLNSLEEQTEIIKQQARSDNQHPPLDFNERKKKYDYWRKKVGWIK